MKRLRGATFALSCLCLIFSFSFAEIVNVEGDPIYLGRYTDNSLLFFNGTVSMPNADVMIDIHPLHTFEVYCDFSVESDTTHNSSVAFVYPYQWDEGESETSREFNISIDSEHVNYSIVNYENLNFSQGPESSGQWINLNYAVFNMSYIEGQTHHIILSKKIMNPPREIDGLTFEYYLGTARYWLGNTHEIITMNVYNYQGLLDYGFRPEENLVVTTSDDVVTAIWDFYINSFSENEVRFFGVDHMWTPPYEEDPYEETLDYVLPWALAVGLAILVIVWCAKKKSG